MAYKIQHYGWVPDLPDARDHLYAAPIVLGQQIKTLTGEGGALAGPVTAYVYDWNMLPIGQALWLKELES
jgi:hypothetical protein